MPPVATKSKFEKKNVESQQRRCTIGEKKPNKVQTELNDYGIINVLCAAM